MESNVTDLFLMYVPAPASYGPNHILMVSWNDIWVFNKIYLSTNYERVYWALFFVPYLPFRCILVAIFSPDISKYFNPGAPGI